MERSTPFLWVILPIYPSSTKGKVRLGPLRTEGTLLGRANIQSISSTLQQMGGGLDEGTSGEKVCTGASELWQRQGCPAWAPGGGNKLPA